METILGIVQVAISIILILLILLHSGKDAGLSGAFGIGGGGSSFGGGSLVERNLDRWTIFFCDPVRRQHDRPAQDLTLRRPAAPLLLVCAALGGCGGDDEEAPASGEFAPEPAPLVRIAMADRPLILDPLYADSRAERLVSRQIHEPLISTESGPFGQTRARLGLASPIGSRSGGTIWLYRLRPGVVFQDGNRFDPDAVGANVDRWIATGIAARLMPGLRGVDSPQPGLLRFLFELPAESPDLALGDGRLGIVSPGALPPVPTAPVSGEESGTGPFELRRDAPVAAGETLLARNSEWWGARFDLGPGTDQLAVVHEPEAGARLEALATGEVEIADQLAAGDAEALAEMPLLTAVAAEGRPLIGVDRSVRGLASSRPDQSLADIWLTVLR